MQALVLFGVVMLSLIKIMDVYDSDLLLDIGITTEQFTIIMGIFSILAGASLSFKNNRRKRKNRTLKYLSLTYIISCIIVGIIATIWTSSATIPSILLLIAVQKMEKSNWMVLENKYLKNFTKEKNRSKITFAYSFITLLIAGGLSILSGLLLNKVNIENAFLIVSIIGLGAIVLTLDFMRTRIGLRPSKYRKEDINF